MRVFHSHIHGTSVPWVVHGGRCPPLCDVTGVTVEMSHGSRQGRTGTERDGKRFREMRWGQRQTGERCRRWPSGVVGTGGEGEIRGGGRCRVGQWDYRVRGGDMKKMWKGEFVSRWKRPKGRTGYRVSRVDKIMWGDGWGGGKGGKPGRKGYTLKYVCNEIGQVSQFIRTMLQTN